jgi:hypothetical protein
MKKLLDNFYAQKVLRLIQKKGDKVKQLIEEVIELLFNFIAFVEKLKYKPALF